MPILKIAISGIIIWIASELGKKSGKLGGLILSLPLTTLRTDVRVNELIFPIDFRKLFFQPLQDFVPINKTGRRHEYWHLIRVFLIGLFDQFINRFKIGGLTENREGFGISLGQRAFPQAFGTSRKILSLGDPIRTFESGCLRSLQFTEY